MKNTNKQKSTNEHIFEYKAMSQKGTVPFCEKAVFRDIVAYFEKEQDMEWVIQVCDDALAQHVYSYEFLINKSHAFLTLGLDEEALESAEQALAYSPNDLTANMACINSLMQLGREDEADKKLEAITKNANTNQSKTQIFWLQAEIFEQQGLFEKMFEALTQMYKIGESDNEESILNKIWFSVEMSGMYEESVKFHLSVIDNDPYCYLAWFNLGHAYFCLEEYEESGEAFEYVNIIKKDFELAYKDGAEAFLMARNYKKALDCLTEYLEIAEPDSEVFTKLGLCHEHLNEIDIAKTYYLQAIKLNACNSLGLFRLGECYMAQEDWATAISYYNQAIEMDCGKEEYLAALAEAYYRTKNIQQAREFFQRATEMAPELSQYWAKYAVFLMALGDGEEAANILDEARIHAGGTELLYCKVACLFAISKRDEALTTLSEALEENMSLLESLYTYSPDLQEDTEVKKLIEAYRK